jgi:hypothetical protein
MSKPLLIFSLRNLYQDLCRCSDYEFEDVIDEVSNADFYLPDHRYRKLVLSVFSQSLSRKTLGVPWNPSFRFPKIEKNYDVFFAMLMFAYDLEVLHRMPDWSSKVGYSICYIDESFDNSFKLYSSYLMVLRRFDCVVINCSQTEHAVLKAQGVKVLVVSSGIDAIRFFPGLPRSSRPIDIFSIGRRDDEVHGQYLKLESDDEWLYLYDTAVFKAFIDYRKNRENLSKMMSRSKFFVVNLAKFDCPEDIGIQEEIGFRYFEGAAAGNVIVGPIPNNPNFKKHFPWKESVVELPKDSIDIPDFMKDLKTDADRLARISFDNVKGSLEMHDYVHRWEAIVEGCGLEIPSGIQLRKEKLQELISSLSETGSVYV